MLSAIILHQLIDDLKITWYFLGGHTSSVTAAKVIDQQRRWNRRLLISSFLFRTKLFFDGSLLPTETSLSLGNPGLFPNIDE